MNNRERAEKIVEIQYGGFSPCNQPQAHLADRITEALDSAVADKLEAVTKERDTALSAWSLTAQVMQNWFIDNKQERGYWLGRLINGGLAKNSDVVLCPVSERDTLKAQLAIARDALEFYASGSHIGTERSDGSGNGWIEASEDGFRARDAIAKIKEIRT